MRTQAPGPSSILAFTAVTEATTGLALVVAPGLVARLLLGAELAGAGTVVAQCFGIALLALVVACWPGRQHEATGPAVRGMLLYNALIACYLCWLGTAGHMSGPLLWPAVALHAAVALLLAWTWYTPSGGAGTSR